MKNHALLRLSNLVVASLVLIAASASQVAGQQNLATPASTGRVKAIYNNGTISFQPIPAISPGISLTDLPSVEYWFGSGGPALLSGGARGGRGGGGRGNTGGGFAPMLTAEQLTTNAIVTPALARQLAGNLRAEPAGFQANVFATAPVANYPAGISVAPDGTVYVGVDGNAAQGQIPNGAVGRIVRLRDTNGDGVADEAKLFVPNVDSVRGLIWDHDRLIALHAPYVSAYVDKNGDGVVEEEKILIKGAGRPIAFQRVDHGYQSIKLGIDGWIYLALGDEGFFNAEGTDGRTIQLHGGGVVRFRRDGSGLEVFAYGTRNIYAVAVGPLLDIIARDNTNDGGGWDVRMHYFTGLGDHGYPSRFVSYSDEIIQPIAEYNGGSGVGATWLDEPGIPAAWNDAAYTGDYGRTGFYRQSASRNGATVTISNEKFLTMSNPIEMDVDANSVLYASSWVNGGFTYSGPDKGYIARIVPTGYRAEPLPDFEKLSNSELVKLLESPSQKRRLEAQGALLRRTGIGLEITSLLQTLATDMTKRLHYRVAALFTLKQAIGAASHNFIGKLASDPTIAAWAIRALADDVDQARTMPMNVVVNGLKSSDPRTRLESIVALARAGATAQIPAIAPYLTDADPVIAHTAFQSFRLLNAADASFAILDDRSASEPMRAAALRVLQTFHQSKVVDGLIARLRTETDAQRRGGLITVLGRLYNTEAEWDGNWWSTRPSTVGPYFSPATWNESPKIAAALDTALQKAAITDAVAIGRAYTQFSIPAGDSVLKLVSVADQDPALLALVTERFATAAEVPSNAIPVLVRAATAPTTAAAVRSQAALALLKTDSAEAWNAIIPAMRGFQQPASAVGPGSFGGRAGGGAPLLAAATVTVPYLTRNQDTALAAIPATVVTESRAAVAARTALNAAIFAQPANPADMTAKLQALQSAELALANATATAFAALQASSDKLSPAQIAVVAQQGNRVLAVGDAVAAAPFGGRGGGAFGGRGGAGVRGGGRGGFGGRGGGRGGGTADQVRLALLDTPRLNQFYKVFIDEADKMNGDSSQLADGVLLGLAGKRIGPVEGRQAAAAAIDAGWRIPQRRLQIMTAAVTARDTSRAVQIVEAMDDADPDLAQAARYAVQQLGIDANGIRAEAQLPRIRTLQEAQVLDAVASATGDVQRGQQLFNELSCTACHTVSANEAPKGPFLGAIANKFPDRRNLAEQILNPNKEIAQGFLSNHIETKDGTEMDAFVVTEAADSITVRNVAGVEQRILKSNIVVKREESGKSLMPTGLAGNLSIKDLASLLDYLKSLAPAQ
jgi:putative heme-binding domain-containing protein